MRNVLQQGFTYEKVDMSFPEPTWPSDTGLTLLAPPTGELIFSGHQTVNISGGSRAERIRMNTNNHILNVYTGSSDIILKVKSFRLNGGKLVLHGSGRLLLYIEESFEGGGNFVIAPNPNPDIPNASIVVFVKSGGTFNMRGTPEFEGAIYGPNANVDLQGNVAFAGSIIANSITGGGNPTIRYKKIDSTDLGIHMYRRGLWQQ